MRIGLRITGGGILSRWIARFLQLFKKREAALPDRDRQEDTQSVYPPEAPQQKSQSAEAERQQSKPEPRVAPIRRRGVTIIVGLDFGTSSTKVLYRRRGEGEATILLPDRPAEGYPNFVTPSLVRLADRRLHFGADALRSTQGQLERSLKVRLLQEAGSSHDGGSLQTDLFVTLYIAWTLGRAKQVFDEKYGIGAYRVILNAAAPMDHVENTSLKQRYLRIIGAAWDSVFGSKPQPICQGVSIDEAASRFSSKLEPGIEIPPIEHRLFEVLPETIAPLVSLGCDPRIRKGKYLVVDMGAGTTELSINQVPARQACDPVVCYFDQSIGLGADQFKTSENDSELIGELLHHMRTTWGKGYEKDKDNVVARDGWRNLIVLLAGGGTQRDSVRRAIKQHHHQVLYPWGTDSDTTYKILTHEPQDIIHPKGSSSSFTANRFLLAVAHGLSIERQTWPIVYSPNETEPIWPTPVRDSGAVDPWRER